ncbi:ABC transporter ATP-binding protein [Fervidobacterium thailandense]|uniref:ABC transporter n=1 Tax=Fervidobacterium thailandense TaxID=1008305 RepID=A0A1E3G3T6_9BACT|nr:ABC transporter ATP-binding protein [Fervidobacterium thailandense]ODN30822.1 ABC transporter [Fervidobacterium thailandense]
MSYALKIENLYFSYDTNFSLEDVNLQIPEGILFGIIGPNGSGKTTLLSLIMKFLKPSHGRIEIFGHDTRKLSHKSLARLVAYIAQDFNPAYDFSVEEIVEMGGIARRRSFFESVVYEEELLRALSIVDLVNLRKRPFSTLSGGQQRRALIARAIYQNTPVIVADELTNHLDLGQAIKVMDYLKSLTRMGKTIVITLHDLGFATKYCDILALMDNGRVISVGRPNEVLTEETISRIYKAKVRVIKTSDVPYPWVVF